MAQPIQGEFDPNEALERQPGIIAYQKTQEAAAQVASNHEEAEFRRRAQGNEEGYRAHWQSLIDQEGQEQS